MNELLERHAQRGTELEWIDLEDHSVTRCGLYKVERLPEHRRETWRLLKASFMTQYVMDFGGTDPRAAAKKVAQELHELRILRGIQPTRPLEDLNMRGAF